MRVVMCVEFSCGYTKAKYTVEILFVFCTEPIVAVLKVLIVLSDNVTPTMTKAPESSSDIIQTLMKVG